MPPPNPWGNSKPNLRGVRLTEEEKAWLGQRVHRNRKEVKKLMMRYDLNRKTLEKYAKCFREGVTIKASSGRKSILDADDLKELKAFVGKTRIHKSLDEVRIKVNELAMNRATERGMYGPQVKPISNRTFRLCAARGTWIRPVALRQHWIHCVLQHA